MTNKRPKLKWNNISIKQYLEIQTILTNDNIESENKVLEIIPIIWPEIDPNEIPMNIVFDYIKDITALLNSEIQPDKVQKEYVIGEYTCRISDIDKMTISLFIDYLTYTANKSDEHLIDILATVFVPKNAKYNDNTYDLIDLKDGIENLPITLVPTVLKVFQKLLSKLYRHFLKCSTAQIIMQKEMTWKMKMKWMKALPLMLKMEDGLTS